MASDRSEVVNEGERLAGFVLAVARDGDRDAFAALFAHFAPRIKAYLMRLGADAALAEELAQEAMIMVWRRAGTFDPRRSAVSTWVFTIARNKRIDALRRERPDVIGNLLCDEVDPEDPVLQPEPGEAADETVLRGQETELLKTALRRLPQEQAELVRMAYFEDKAHGAIAEETGLPLGTVKSRLRLALGHLRQALREED